MHVKSSCTLPKNSRSVADLSALSTPELVGLAQAGDLQAFDPLYRRYAGVVLAYASNRLWAYYDRRSGAEEVAATTWAAALEAIGCYQPRASGEDPFRAWLFKIARYRCHNLINKVRGEIPAGGTCDEEWLTDLPTPATHTDTAVYAAVDAVAAAAKTDMMAQLYEAIDTLPADQQTVVRMRLDNLDLCHIAHATGWAYTRVMDQWKQAQATLRAWLLDDGQVFADPHAVRAAAMSLPPVQRRVALMRLAGVPTPEVVQATGLPRHSVYAAWHKAQNNLRRILTGAVTPKRPVRPDTDRLRQVAVGLPRMQRQVALMRLDGARERDIVNTTGISRRSASAAWRRACSAFARHGLAIA